MTAGTRPAVPAGETRPGLLERLMAAVRPEFRADELAFGPRHRYSAGLPAGFPDAAGRDASGAVQRAREPVEESRQA